MGRSTSTHSEGDEFRAKIFFEDHICNNCSRWWHPGDTESPKLQLNAISKPRNASTDLREKFLLMSNHKHPELLEFLGSQIKHKSSKNTIRHAFKMSQGHWKNHTIPTVKHGRAVVVFCCRLLPKALGNLLGFMASSTPSNIRRFQTKTWPPMPGSYHRVGSYSRTLTASLLQIYRETVQWAEWRFPETIPDPWAKPSAGHPSTGLCLLLGGHWQWSFLGFRTGNLQINSKDSEDSGKIWRNGPFKSPISSSNMTGGSVLLPWHSEGVLKVPGGSAGEKGAVWQGEQRPWPGICCKCQTNANLTPSNTRRGQGDIRM